MKWLIFASGCASVLFRHCEASDTASSTECNYALELLALQDGSDSFNHFINEWKSTAADLHEALLNHFGAFKMGLSAFTDKPVPFRGYGDYGSFQEYNLDYCYESKVPLSEETQTFIQGLKSMQLSAGGDIPEGQFEAMLYAALDEKAGWSDPEVTHSADGRPIARILMLITDAKSHEALDASKGIAKWNAPREYPGGYSQASTGGFGSHAFYDEYGINSFNNANGPFYTELADLYALKDAHAANEGSPLSLSQELRLQELINKFGPEVYPALEHVQHPGDNSVVSDCTKTEYPSFAQVASALESRRIIPIFILTSSKAKSFYEWYATRMNITYALATMENEDLTSVIVETISNVVAKICVPPTTPIPSTLLASHTEPSTLLAYDTEPATIITSNTEPSTPKVLQTEPATGIPSQTDQAGTETASEENSKATTTSEPVVVIVPPSGAESPSHGGAIAGATAGIVGGLGAVGVVAWKAMGFGTLSSGEAGLEGADQIEAANDEVEREAMEEITMDMFN